jgi:hypothetical protein
MQERRAPRVSLTGGKLVDLGMLPGGTQSFAVIVLNTLIPALRDGY